MDQDHTFVMLDPTTDRVLAECHGPDATNTENSERPTEQVRTNCNRWKERYESGDNSDE